VLARGRSVEKVFTVSPGALVDLIRVRVGGARALTVDPNGALVATTGLGPVTFTAPVAYQERDGVRRTVAAASDGFVALLNGALTSHLFVRKGYPLPRFLTKIASATQWAAFRSSKPVQWRSLCAS
jgi:hypothetical protein